LAGIVSFAPQIGELPEIRWVSCGDLSVDHAYQRMAEEPSSKRLIRHIADNWDWRLCAPLTVSDRAAPEAGMYVIDGQHRLAAARLRGDIWELPCIISRFHGIEDEARLFVALNSARRQVGEVEKFHARVASKDHYALAAKRVIEDAGMKVARYTDAQFWKPLECGFPTVVERTIRNRECHALFALEVLAGAYPDKPLVRGKDIFEGLVWLWYKEKLWEDELTRHDMAEVIGEKRQREWLGLRNRLRETNDKLGMAQAMGIVIGEAIEIEIAPVPESTLSGCSLDTVSSYGLDAQAAGLC
jgi:hypothetical protein